MGLPARIVGAVALGCLLGACAQISGLSGYTPGDRVADGGVLPAREAGDDGTYGDDALVGTDGDDALVATDAPPVGADALPGADGTPPEGDAAQDADAGGPDCSAGCTYACARGGCNAAGGSCSAASPCYCTADSQCGSGKCLKVSGQNDVSCGAGCTGTGAADGFNCTLGAPGIPAACAVPTFGYTPSNFALAGHTPPSTSTTINCNTTYSSSTHAFTGWCAGQTAPTIYASVAQSGGPSVDILAFRNLTLAAGSTLTLTSSGGGNAVILAVYGDASIQGIIQADASPGASNTTTAGASGPGGNYNCGASVGGSPGSDGHTSAGAGGGASAAGGTGPGGVGGSTTAGGVARPNASLSPLYGGCPGGASGSWACRTSGGGGGGAVQISAAGALTVTGTITARGGTGGTSTCTSGGCAPGPNNTYGGGGGGGGSGGAILLEGNTVSAPLASTVVNGGAGGTPPTTLQELGVPGAGGTSGSPTGGAGSGSTSNGCGSDNQSGAGGGGGYGYLKTSTGSAAAYVCTTTLSPAPVCNNLHTACLCVADLDCPSGKCSNASSQCSGTCTGPTAAGAYDTAGCAILVAAASGP